MQAGANGGSGGGCGSTYMGQDLHVLCSGGASDGGTANDGYIDWWYSSQVAEVQGKPWVLKGGIGQGRTTRAFGDSNGTLYAGGGGGSFGEWGYLSVNLGLYNSNGGAGGGGNGCRYDQISSGIMYIKATPGEANTGGGGGGGLVGLGDIGESSDGGSGIAIIRWGY